MQIRPMFRNGVPLQAASYEHADGWIQAICINENYDNLVEVGYGERVEVLDRFMWFLEKLKLIRGFDFYSVKKAV